MTSLQQSAADACEELSAAAARYGSRIKLDPLVALSRGLRPDPSGERVSTNGHCRLVRTLTSWIAVNLARSDDRRSVPAWIGCELEAEPWHAIEVAATQFSSDELLRRAIELHLPVSIVGETAGFLPDSALRVGERKRARPLVIDLSALWAGPLAGALLAEAGCEVWKVESRTRRDTTRWSSPELDRSLNGGKSLAVLDLDESTVTHLVATADVLITSARPRALASLGISPARAFEQNPNLLWLAITAHGWDGDAALRIGFGDDCAAAGNLVQWSEGAPAFLGDALADPLTGITGATEVLKALCYSRAGMVKISLAGVAHRFAAKL